MLELKNTVFTLKHNLYVKVLVVYLRTMGIHYTQADYSDTLDLHKHK